MARPKGSKTSKPLIVDPLFKKEMAEEAMAANKIIKAMRKSTAHPEDITYALSMLADFDKAIRPTIDVNAKVHGMHKYTPIQLYDILYSYFHTAIANGRNMTIGHMCWYSGFNRTNFFEMLNEKYTNPHYQFVKDFVSFLEAHMEYTAQDKQNPAFHIFWLKNRGWKDKFEIEASSTAGALSEEERRKMQERVAEFSEGKVLPPV